MYNTAGARGGRDVCIKCIQCVTVRAIETFLLLPDAVASQSRARRIPTFRVKSNGYAMYKTDIKY